MNKFTTTLAVIGTLCLVALTAMQAWTLYVIFFQAPPMPLC